LSTKIASLYAEIGAKTEGLDKGLKDAKSGLTDVGKTAQGTSGAIGGLTGKLIGMIDPVDMVIAGVTALAMYLKNATAAASESAQVDAKLGAVLKATGNSVRMSTDEFDDMATSLSKMTGIDDEAVKSAEAVMLTFRSIGEDVFPQAMQSAADMSAVMGQDLRSSVVQIGKALNEPIEGASALRRVGVQLTDQQEAQIKTFMESGDVLKAQGVILQELQAEFGGAAEAVNEAGDGSENLKVAFGNLAEAIGGTLLPATREGKKGLTGLVDSITEGIDKSTDFREALARANPQLYEQYKNTSHVTKAMTNAVDDFARSQEYASGMAEYAARMLDAESEAAGTNATALMTAEEAAKAKADADAAMTSANKSFLSTVMDVSDAQEKYNSGMAEAKSLLDAHKIKTAEYQKRVADLTAEYDNATKKIVADLLLMKYTADGTFDDQEINSYISVLQKFGLVTADAANEARNLYSSVDSIAAAQQRLTAESITNMQKGKALGDMYTRMSRQAEGAGNSIDSTNDSMKNFADEGAKDAAGAAHDVVMALNQINGASADAYIDVWVREHGHVPTGMTSESKTVASSVQSGTGTANRASGGPLAPVTVVGDAPGGVWTPYTEVIANGRVYSNRESRAMRAAGMLNGANYAAFGWDDLSHSPNTNTKRGNLGGGSSGGGGSKARSGGNVFLPGASSTAADIASAQSVMVNVAMQTGGAVADLSANVVSLTQSQQQAAAKLNTDLISRVDQQIAILQTLARSIGAEVGYQVARKS